MRHFAMCVLLCFLAVSACAETIILVTPASAPNVFGSPSYAAWEANAVTALRTGVSTLGSGASKYTKTTGPISVSQNIVTNFSSWQGVAAPNTPDFAGELGNRVAFGVDIRGNGSKVSISQLSFSATSTDPGNTLGFGFAAGSYNYGTGYMGINFVDGIEGNGNDIFITSGLNTQLVDRIVGRGSGNAWAVLSGDPGATNQDKINNGVAAIWPGSPFNFTGTYSIARNSGTVTGSGTVVFGSADGEPVPLPGVAAGVLALFGVGGTRRRRRSV